MVIDIFSYNGEADLLEIRLNILDEFVDEFIIVEAPRTFSGRSKPLYYEEQKDRFTRWHHKIKYYVIDENYTREEVQQAYDSPYTHGEERWMTEFLHKEALQKTLAHLQDDDLVYVGDVDEIWEPRPYNGIEKLKLRVYTYYLNMRSSEEFWGPMRVLYKDIKGHCLNDIRNNVLYRTSDYQGWHFTNQGGREAVEKKILDQYNTELFNGTLIKDLMPSRFGIKDFIGRNFLLTVDDSDLPQFLKDNKEIYANFRK